MKKLICFIFVAALCFSIGLISAAAGEPLDGATTSEITLTNPKPKTPVTSVTVVPGLPGAPSAPTSANPTEGLSKISGAVSPALSIIAADSGMAKAGLAGNNIAFSDSDFLRALNVSKINEIKIEKVPTSADGVLLLGSTVVTEQQTISRANLGMLNYDPATDATGVASFDFSVNGGGYVINCAMYLLDKVNGNPTVDMTAETLLDVSTHKNTALFGKLGGYDPEGDELTYEIVEQPSHGLLLMNDRNSGKYTYFPCSNFTGRDRFQYIVHDRFGNYSSSATVMLTVSTAATQIVYQDMKGNSACCAATTLTERGIMSGTQVGANYYFNPESGVTRSEFLVMAMNAAGINDLPEATSTGFADDSVISASQMKYAAAAKSLGYITGSTDAKGQLCFCPDEELTRAEAALIVDNIIDGKSHLKNGSVSPVFADSAEVPVWAKSSVGILSTLGLLDDEEGKILANDKITRGETAEMLAAVLKIVK